MSSSIRFAFDPLTQPLLLSLCSTVVGVTAVKLLQRVPVFRVRAELADEDAGGEDKEVEAVEIGDPVKLAW